MVVVVFAAAAAAAAAASAASASASLSFSGACLLRVEVRGTHSPQSRMQLGVGIYYFSYPTLKNVTRFSALAFIAVTSTVPSGVFLFWITSNVFAITRTLIMRNDRVRTALRVPLVSEIAALKYLPKPESI